MKLKITLLFLLFISIGYSQVTNEGQPKSWEITELADVKAVVMPKFDLEALQKEDAANDKQKDKPWRYGFEFLVDNNLTNSGVWTILPNGDRVWRIHYVSKGAKTINFLFSDYYMPKGANVYLYNSDRSDLLGAYDAGQNNDERVLGTWMVTGDDIWIEYYEPAAVAGAGKLEIFKVIHGYRTVGNFAKSPDQDLNVSGNCNYDVNCSMAGIDDLKDINKKSVGLIIVNNSSFCTGALINNVTNDGTPYFLTANHCYAGNLSQWAFRFNWISPNPVCAQNTPSTTNAPNYYQTLSGAELKAKRGKSDFLLLKITAAIPSNWNIVWAGWSRSEVPPASTFGIHHPSGDIMKVSRDLQSPTIDNSEGQYMWNIESWDYGVTEGGSSGSPLFDNNGRIIGQLYGGSSECNGLSGNGGFDVYGRFGISWDEGPTSEVRLKNWLDPNNTNAMTVNYRLNPTASLKDVKQELVTVYPNPSAGIFTVTISASAQYSLYDVVGHLVKTGGLTSGDNTIDLTGTANGIYILKVIDAGGKSGNYKLVKE
ncbi:T9SS type A sorting domain-containing protein [Flavobacterium cerinum]|uniref:T9SS type A sorting domain-containing protein n=1 Tax=Flavobacterium cerinum TaxID=2502784 RepID=A0A444GMZ5_9FLAO|nr:T9SS type A sorting domain-containing protein [Flavobacterium cerinum]RWW92297.1 T9SS type A sorting domain-containing protein [Flavobacterium cerinum]